jgi:hypothetical protein
MKRIIVVLGLAVLMAVFIAGPVSAQAVTEHDVQTFTLTNTVEDCDLTEIEVQSTARFVLHSTTDANGGIHEFFTLSLHGVTATEVNGEAVHFLTHDYEGSNRYAVPRTSSKAQTALIISSGPSDNRILTTFVHFTVNANGEVTAVRFDQSIECRG